MRRAGVAVIAAAILTAGLTACDGGVNTSADSPILTQAAEPPATTAAPDPGSSKPAASRVGDTITLHGTDDGSKLAVTLVTWVDPAKAAEFFTPSAGKRYVAAQIRLTNTGTAAYDDTPSNGMQLADGEGQRFGATFAEVSTGPAMPSDVKLSPGDKALGYVVFEVPKKSKIVSVQFAMDSGFADETGRWIIH